MALRSALKAAACCARGSPSSMAAALPCAQPRASWRNGSEGRPAMARRRSSMAPAKATSASRRRSAHDMRSRPSGVCPESQICWARARRNRARAQRASGSLGARASACSTRLAAGPLPSSLDSTSGMRTMDGMHMKAAATAATPASTGPSAPRPSGSARTALSQRSVRPPKRVCRATVAMPRHAAASAPLAGIRAPKSKALWTRRARMPVNAPSAIPTLQPSLRLAPSSSPPPTGQRPRPSKWAPRRSPPTRHAANTQIMVPASPVSATS